MISFFQSSITYLFPPKDVEQQSMYKKKLFSHIGTLLIGIGIVLPVLFYAPLWTVELGYRIKHVFASNHEYKDPFDAIVTSVPDPAFSLYIPKIDAVGKIISVDPYDKDRYMEALSQGIAHAQNSGLPNTSNSTIFLFAHSTDSPLNVTRYNAVFYLLRELEAGDELFIAYQNKPYRYVVYDKKIVEPTDVSYLKPSNDLGIEQVILQTCWPPGTVQKRLLIFAQRKNVEQALVLPR